MGTARRCPHCLHMTVPRVPKGGSYSMSGCKLSFENFEGLLSDALTDDSGRVIELLRTWFGYDIVQVGPDILIRNAAGEMIDKLWLHLCIQSDAARQGDLYNAAMTLWR